MAPKAKTDQNLVLPTIIVGLVDISRVERELQDLNDMVAQAAIRHTNPVQVARSSRLLEELATINHLDLNQTTDRNHLRTFLDTLKHSAPTIQMSFAVDPPATFVAKLITWLRREIHQQVLLQIGLQPTIAAGTIVRTANRSFDFSLRQHFKDQHQLLISKLEDTSE